jgi:proteic killer suppression protein
MISSCKCKETEKIWKGTTSTRLPIDIQNVSRRKLRMIDAATTIGDLRVPPNNRLEALQGDRIGQYSIRINEQYRICFKWDLNTAYDVEIIDYH